MERQTNWRKSGSQKKTAHTHIFNDTGCTNAARFANLANLASTSWCKISVNFIFILVSGEHILFSIEIKHLLSWVCSTKWNTCTQKPTHRSEFAFGHMVHTLIARWFMFCPAVDSWKSVGALRWNVDDIAHKNQLDKWSQNCHHWRLVHKNPNPRIKKTKKQKTKNVKYRQWSTL